MRWGRTGCASTFAALVLIAGVLTGGCSQAQPPASPRLPPPPPAPAYREQFADADTTGFPTHFTIVFTREYGMWKYRACTLEVSLFLNRNQARLVCSANDRAPATAGRDVTVDEAAQLRRLAKRADLYGADHIGRDLTPTDGTFDMIRFRPLAGGRAVVLVTSGNRSFADDEARRDLLGLLSSLFSDLLAAAS